MTPIALREGEVRGLLDGTLREIRREVKPQPPSIEAVVALSGTRFSIFNGTGEPSPIWRVAGPVWAVRELIGVTEWTCPLGAPGSEVWCQEAWRAHERASDGKDFIEYAAGGDMLPLPNTPEHAEWIVGRFGAWQRATSMPRWASRLTVRVESVRVERGEAWEWVYGVRRLP